MELIMRRSNSRWKTRFAWGCAALAVCLSVVPALWNVRESAPRVGNGRPRASVGGANHDVTKGPGTNNDFVGENGFVERMLTFEAVDKALAALPKVPMAFNTPPPMNIDDVEAKVELRIGPRQLPAELIKSITAPGTVQVHEVQISNRMKAILSGDPDGLTITPLTPALQVVSGEAPSTWIWSVKPRKAGQYPVHVELEAVVKIDGEVTPRLIDVFDGIIAVTITPGQRAGQFVKDSWQWLWTALLVPVGGWWWKRRETKKAEDKKPDDAPKIIVPK